MTKRSNTQEFIDKCKKIHSNYDYSKVNYLNAHIKVEVVCPKHGSFFMKPNHLLSNHGCPNCGYKILGESKKSNNHEFIEKCKKIHPEYDYSKVNYVTAHIKVEVICPTHGSFFCSPNNLLRDHGCPKCAIEVSIKRNTSNTQEFVDRCKKIHLKYDYSKVNYIDARTKVEVICPTHGSFFSLPANLLRDHGCPSCKSSKGEKFIANWLKVNNYEFTPQKRFPTCRLKNTLPFDFYIHNRNLLIEYQGEQHFRPIEIWGGMNSFLNTVKRDHIKYKWSRDNGYVIIYLDYTMSEEFMTEILETIKNYR